MLFDLLSLKADYRLPSIDLKSSMCPFPSSSSGPSKDPVEHIYEMHDSNCRPTLSLKVYSWAQSSDHLPVFYDGCQISGDVEISLEKPDFIQAVVISVSSTLNKTIDLTLQCTVERPDPGHSEVHESLRRRIRDALGCEGALCANRRNMFEVRSECST